MFLRDTYAVMGNPIHHSLSPVIHRHFAIQTRQDLDYLAFQIDFENFKTEVDRFFKEGGKGLNITAPFKQQAWALSTQRTARAEIARAVNTFYLNSDGILVGDNTDGVGFVNYLIQSLEIDPAKQAILVLGAGGAAYGVVSALLQTHPKSLSILNRTVNNAKKLAEHFKGIGHVKVLKTPEKMDYTLLINTTSAETPCSLPSSIQLDSKAKCIDLRYGQAANSFLDWAKAQGVDHVNDGWGMLVEQAAEAFFIWRGIRPDTHEIIRERHRIK